jgi:hypothetical protein
MTQKRAQNVIPRNREKNSGRSYGQAFRKHKNFNSSKWQRGSINSTTLTLVFGLVIIGGVAVLGFFYLGQVLGTASQGSDIQRLEEKVVELKEQQTEVELEGARLRSIDTIEDRVKQLNLTTTSKVTFLEVTPDKVAALNQ